MVLTFVSIIGIKTYAYDYESGYSITSARKVQMGVWNTKTWSEGNDSLDCYNVFTVNSRGYLTISAQKAIDSFGQSGEMSFILYNSKGEEIWRQSSASSGTVLDTFSLKVGLKPGTYYLNIRPTYSVIRGNLKSKYMLWFNASNAYEAEPNDTAKDATFIANGQSVNGFLQSSEEDFYYIYCESYGYKKITISEYTAMDADSVYFNYTTSEGEDSFLDSFISQADGSAYRMVYFTPGINYIYLKSYGSKNYEYYIKVEDGFKQGTQFTSNGIKYKVTSISSSTSGECSVVGGSKTNIVIPKTVVYQGATFDVTSIAKNAFKNNKQIKTVKTASYSYLKSIGTYAFSGCTKLKSVDFSNTDVEVINTGTYKNCKSLTKFKYRDYKLSKIGKEAFYGCKKLSTVDMSFSKIKTIGDSAFKNCTGLREVKFEDLTSIGKEAFKGCKKLKVLNFMWCKNLKKFGKNCFYGISKGADIYVYKRSMYTKLCKTSGVPGGVWIHWMW